MSNLPSFVLSVLGKSRRFEVSESPPLGIFVLQATQESDDKELPTSTNLLFLFGYINRTTRPGIRSTPELI